MHIILTSKNLRANAQHFYFDFKESSSDGGKTNTPSTQVLPVEELEGSQAGVSGQARRVECEDPGDQEVQAEEKNDGIDDKPPNNPPI